MEKQSNPWKINNRRWLESRQTRWAKRIQPQLKKLSSFWAPCLQSHDFPFLKAYFLKGEILDYDKSWLNKLNYVVRERSVDKVGTPYQIPVLFKVWFYPEDNPVLFKRWCEEANSLDGQYYDFVARNFNSVGDKKMEFFAGRSYYLDRYLVPKESSSYIEMRYELSQKSEQKRSAILPNCSTDLQMILEVMLENKLSLLGGGGRFVYAFCHELFADLLRSTDLSSKSRSGDTYEWLIKAMFNSLLYRLSEDFYPKFPLIQMLKKEMTEQFEQGITPEIDAIWKEAQKGPLVLTKN